MRRPLPAMIVKRTTIAQWVMRMIVGCAARPSRSGARLIVPPGPLRCYRRCLAAAHEKAGGPGGRPRKVGVGCGGLGALAPVELLHQVAEAGAAVALLAQVLVVVVVAARERLDGQRDLALVLVHVDDLHVDLVALLHHVARVLGALLAQLGDVDQPLDAGLDLDEGAEVGELRHLPLQLRADRVALGERRPRIGLRLLDAEAEALVLDVDVQHHRLDHVTLLELLARVLDALVPGDVGDVHQAVDALLDAHEDAEVGDVADLAPDDGADGVLVLEQRPGIRLDLLHAEADPLRLGVDVEHHRLDLVPHVDELRGVLHPLRPAHLADMDEALDALLDLDERAVVGERHHLARHAGADRILLVGAVPRVLLDLLQAQADAFAGGVELEDHHPHFLADLEHLRRVADAAPAHVGDMEQAVDAAQVDEGAVVGEVLHHALQDGALLQVLERLLLQLLALLLEEHAAREDDVAALLVELDDLELELLADELVEVPHRADVDLRPGQERLHADVDGEAALHAPDDDALDELVDGHLPFGLVADVDDGIVLGQLDDGSADDLALLDLAAARLTLREQGGEVFTVRFGRTGGLSLHSVVYSMSAG